MIHEKHPYTYVETYFAKRELEKDLKKYSDDIKLIPGYHGTASSNLRARTVALPFTHPLTFSDLKTLLEHEIGHFKITVEPPKFSCYSRSIDLTKANVVCNILDDIIINESQSRAKLEDIHYKLVGNDEKTLVANRLTLWKHLDYNEKEKVIKVCQEVGIIHDDIKIDEIIDIFDDTVDIRKDSSSLYEFIDKDYDDFMDFYELFTDQLYDIGGMIGDGHCEYKGYWNPPDKDLYNKLCSYLQRFKYTTQHDTIEKQFYGKRINRRFINKCPDEIYPFKHKYTKTTVHEPTITCILDCSGSMEGSPERRAKSFLCAALKHTRTAVIAHNECFTEIIRDEHTMERLPMDDDESFDKLPNKLKKLNYQIKSDFLVVVTDLRIDSDEADGLNKVIEDAQVRKKYLLCVEPTRINKYPQIKLKRINIADNDRMIKFCKQLVSGV